jgi:hypothetical protein
VKHKTIIFIGIGIIFVLLSYFLTYGQTKEADELLQSAKLLMFDKKWDEAQKKLEKILEEYPYSATASQAAFYRAKCLENKEGKEQEALKAYKEYIGSERKSDGWAQEAELSIIKLAFELQEKGQSSYLDEIEKRLYRTDKMVKYFAAVKMSSVENKKEARKALPVLEEILKNEKDAELRDRAKIAMLKIDPDYFRDFEEERYERRARILKIRVYAKGEKEPVFSLNIPWTLADLALGAIPAKERKELIDEGDDLDELIERLTSVGGDILEIQGKNTIFKIWID